MFSFCVPFFSSASVLEPIVPAEVWYNVIYAIDHKVYVIALVFVYLLAMLKGYSHTKFEHVAISVVAVLLASNPNSSVFKIVSFAWAGFGAAFGPVVLFALFWRRTNKWGALAGMVSGGAMVFIWKFVIRTTFAGTWLDIYELLPAFIVACLAIVVVSFLTKKPDEEITAIYDEVKVAK